MLANRDSERNAGWLTRTTCDIVRAMRYTICAFLLGVIVAPVTAAELATLATKPATDDLSAAVDELVRNEAHVEGERDVAWTTPVKVSADEVTLRQCETPGDWALVGSGKRAPQTSNTVTEAVLIQVKGQWYVKSGRTVGKC